MRTKVAGDISSPAGFRGGRYLDFRGSLKLLSSPHLRGGDERLLRGILSRGVWNGFLPGSIQILYFHAAWLARRGASAGGFVFFSHVVSPRWFILVVLLVSADLPGII